MSFIVRVLVVKGEAELGVNELRSSYTKSPLQG